MKKMQKFRKFIKFPFINPNIRKLKKTIYEIFNFSLINTENFQITIYLKKIKTIW